MTSTTAASAPASASASDSWGSADETQCHHASAILEVVGQRWSPSILLALRRGGERFSEILAMTAGLSARMLTVRLKQLEAAALVERTVIPTTPVTVRYGLTAQGLDLIDTLHSVAGYVQRWAVDDPAAATTATPSSEAAPSRSPGEGLH